MSEEHLIENVADVYRYELEFLLENIEKNNSDFWSRSLIRTAVAFFESEIYVLKQDLLDYCARSAIQLDPSEVHALKGIRFDLKENGQLAEKPLNATLKSEIKFALNKVCEVRGFYLDESFESVGWQNVLKTISVRHRITHPKVLSDQYVKASEIDECWSAIVWFEQMTGGFLLQEAERLDRALGEQEARERDA